MSVDFKLLRSRIEKEWKTLAGEASLQEAASAFYFMMRDAEMNGVQREIAFEATRQHFLTYGQAMVDVANMLEYEDIQNVSRKN